jgi:hypothetical protein
MFLAILVLVSTVCVGDENHSSTHRSPESTASSSEKNLEEMARTFAASKVLGNFPPSLSAREAEDFLLTPAILVQESLSDKVVVTYPSE